MKRINNIKGQNKKGVLNNPRGRREKIAKALKKIPPESWISISEFSRFMKMKDLCFEVSASEFKKWDLYIINPEYGSLGYEGYGEWNILQERYILVFLLEYAATLGILDLAYTQPERARRDYTKLWGTDDLDYLSRYDGLFYFRINELGKFILGLSNKYEAKSEKVSALRLMPNMEIIVLKELPSSDRIFLSTFTEQVSDQVYKLSESSVLTSIEKGRGTDTIQEFLIQKSDMEFPATVQDFWERIDKKVNQIKFFSNAILLSNSRRLKKVNKNGSIKNSLS